MFGHDGVVYLQCSILKIFSGSDPSEVLLGNFLKLFFAWDMVNWRANGILFGPIRVCVSINHTILFVNHSVKHSWCAYAKRFPFLFSHSCVCLVVHSVDMFARASNSDLYAPKTAPKTS